MVISITRQYEISCGHHLPLHNGKCRTPHGHNYVFEVSVKGDTQKSGSSTGMVLDFAELDNQVKVYLDRIDHKDLNELEFIPQPPTAENIAYWLWSELVKYFPIYSAHVEGTIQLHKIRLYETSKSWVEVNTF